MTEQEQKQLEEKIKKPLKRPPKLMPIITEEAAQRTEQEEKQLEMLEKVLKTTLIPKLIPMATEEAEALLGTLIRRLNPYTNIMHYPPGNLQAYKIGGQIKKEREEKDEETDAEVIAKLAQYELEVDNRYGSQNGGDYLSWEFKGQPQIVKKALRIQFRHPAKNGGWITDHLLIGFAGSNGP